MMCFFASSSSFFCIFSSCFLSLFKCLTFDYEVLDLEFQPQIFPIFPSQELVSRTQLKTEFFSNFASAESVSREINKHHEAFPHADWSFTKAFHWDDPGWVWMAQHCSLSTIIDDPFLILEYTILYWLSCSGWSIFLKKHPAFSWCVWFSCYQIWNKASHAGMLWSCESSN